MARLSSRKKKNVEEYDARIISSEELLDKIKK